MRRSVEEDGIAGSGSVEEDGIAVAWRPGVAYTLQRLVEALDLIHYNNQTDLYAEVWHGQAAYLGVESNLPPSQCHPCTIYSPTVPYPTSPNKGVREHEQQQKL